jgi:catechol 2,3-dioxygenase-like lactoylglutathione lyase family enzyme
MEGSMRAGHIEFFVRDPMVSKGFYEEVLGFTVGDVQGDSFVWLTCGATEFLLRPGAGPKEGSSYRDAATGIVLYTDDLDATKARLEANGLEFSGTDGSDRCLTFTDPDGHWFQLVNPADH